MKAKKASKNKLSLAKAAIIGIASVGVLIFVFVLHFNRSFSDVAREELEAIRSEDVGFAYSLTSKQFQENVSLSDFQAYIDQHPILKDYTGLSFNKQKTENNVKYLHGIVTGSDGTQKEIDFELIYEDGKWKVQNMQLVP